MFIFVPCKYIGEHKFNNYTKLLLSLCLLKWTNGTNINFWFKKKIKNESSKRGKKA
jgi:hypothetical protein